MTATTPYVIGSRGVMPYNGSQCRKELRDHHSTGRSVSTFRAGMLA
jgi:hypothetical protein